MTARLAALGFLVAILPISVDVPALRDSSGRHETRLDGALSRGEFALVTRGCQNQVLREVRNEVRSGALAVEHEFPNDAVIGVRGGVVSDKPSVRVGAVPGAPALPGRTNRYWNPHIGLETRYLGVDLGYLRAERRFGIGDEDLIRPEITGHVRVGDSHTYGAVRFMEDLPLQSDGYLTAEVGGAVGNRSDAAFMTSLYGPYDGGMIGFKGRVWITPQAALQIRAMAGGRSQFSTSVGVSARLP